MTSMKWMLAVLAVAAIVCIAPQAYATQTWEVTASGSSAQWQSLGLAAYHVASTTTLHSHWTYGSSTSQPIYLYDDREGIANKDTGTLWVVWNCAESLGSCSTGVGPTEAWLMLKVDSVVGVRCLFAQCKVLAPNLTAGTAGQNKIKQSLWGDNSGDASTIPSWIVSALNSGVQVNTAATDIRPEDAAFAMCRANSRLGSSTGYNTSDALDGLGYNSNWAAGVCPAPGSAASTYVGNPIVTGLPGANAALAPYGDQANVVSFNISGNDPITNTALPSTFTVVNVGAAPIVFVTAKQNATGLKTVTNATPAQLQQVFSGTNCDATAFGVSGGTGLNIFLREPTSGTMNTTEATLFRGTATTSGGNPSIGLSQESNVGSANPLAGAGCPNETLTGARWRGIGTSEVVAGVQYSNSSSGCTFEAGDTDCLTNQQDGIAYTFFSYGNVSGIADSTAYGYITVNGIDPIFSSYTPSFDPGQNATAGTVPGFNDLKTTAGCNTTNGYPCAENAIWGGGLSFPNVRNGSYPAWSLLRAVTWTTGTDSQLTALKALVTAGQKNVVDAVPDYIPYAAVTCTTSTTPFPCPSEVEDPGLLVLRAHYQEFDGAGTVLAGGLNATNTVENFTKGTTFYESGGDMGGTVFTCYAAQADCPNSDAAPTSPHWLAQSQYVVGGKGTEISTTDIVAGGFTIRASSF